MNIADETVSAVICRSKAVETSYSFLVFGLELFAMGLDKVAQFIDMRQEGFPLLDVKSDGKPAEAVNRDAALFRDFESERSACFSSPLNAGISDGARESGAKTGLAGKGVEFELSGDFLRLKGDFSPQDPNTCQIVERLPNLRISPVQIRFQRRASIESAIAKERHGDAVRLEYFGA
jgi:hypothetical protein